MERSALARVIRLLKGGLTDEDLRVAYRATVTLNNFRLRLAGVGMIAASQLGLLARLRREYPAPAGLVSAPPPGQPNTTLIEKLEKLAQIDPQIFSMGADAVPNARVRYSDDLERRNGLNYAEISRFLARKPSVVLVVPQIVVGGAEIYTANIIRTIRELGHTRILTIVTDQDGLAMRESLTHPALRPFMECDMLSWLDASTAMRPLFLARTLYALAPDAIFVVNSRVGLDALALCGAGLSCVSKLFAAFFSMGRRGLGAPYGTRYPQRIWKTVTLLTDNTPMAEQLATLLPPSASIKVVPNRIVIADNAAFEARLARNRQAQGSRWVWVGRVEPLKGTALLADLARSAPDHQFDIFGPLSGHLSLAGLGLSLPNVSHRGVLTNVSTHDFSAYRGFLFTSMFEGMPNVVLEMAQHALPIISTDVGGLSDLLASDASLFPWNDNLGETSAKFRLAMGYVVSPAFDWNCVRRIHDRVENLHSPAQHRARVQSLIKAQEYSGID